MIARVFIACLLFGAGWAIGELRHVNHDVEQRSLLKASSDLAVNSAAMADRALEHAASCQGTLTICLQHLGFKNERARNPGQ